MEQLNLLWINTGLYQMVWGQGLMLLVGILLIYLAIVKKFEPLLLLPIGFGAILSNIPGANLAVDGGILHLFYMVGIESGAFPLIIFMGVGALTDFGPLLANPKTLILVLQLSLAFLQPCLVRLAYQRLGYLTLL